MKTVNNVVSSFEQQDVSSKIRTTRKFDDYNVKERVKISGTKIGEEVFENLKHKGNLENKRRIME